MGDDVVRVGNDLHDADQGAIDDWNDCTLFCGDEPPRRVPGNIFDLSFTMDNEFLKFKSHVTFVTTCGSDVLTGGCSPHFMQQRINDLQDQFRPVHTDWVAFKTDLCLYHQNKWTVCPETPAQVLAALQTLEPHHRV